LESSNFEVDLPAAPLNKAFGRKRHLDSIFSPGLAEFLSPPAGGPAETAGHLKYIDVSLGGFEEVH
jgi:hypothetical protein